MLARVSVISVRSTSYYFCVICEVGCSCLIWTIVDTEYMFFLFRMWHSAICIFDQILFVMMALK